MNAELLERILACPALPSLPAAAVKVIALTRKPDVSLDELARVVQNDQALATKVLRTVNSSFYGLRRPCASINQALTLLGFSAVKSLALGFSLVSTVQGGAGRFDLTSYWRRSLYTAVAARALAERLKAPCADEAFLGGLLQDIGMIAMHRALGERYEQAVAAAGHHRRLAVQELAAFELQHPDIGAMLATRWGFPHELVMPVKFHERPTAAPAEQADLVKCVGLGNMVHDALTDADAPRAVARLRAHALDWFGFDGAATDEILVRAAEAAKELSGLIRLDTGAAPDVGAALSRGRPAGPGDVPGGLAGSATLEALVMDADRVDPLIGALGREVSLRLGQDMFFTAQTQRRPVTVVALSIDGFGEVVGAHGVEAGDAILVEAVSLLSKRFEPGGGIVGRYAETTLIVVLPGVGRGEAAKVASALRDDIPAASLRWEIGPAGAPVRVTVSVGVASYEPGAASPYTRAPQLFTAAAQACASAAACGGNCVRAFVPKATAA